jgi:hypothetical protein
MEVFQKRYTEDQNNKADQSFSMGLIIRGYRSAITLTGK